MYEVLTKAGSLSSTGQQLPSGIEIGMGAKLVSTQKIFAQGDYTQTTNQLDWAIEGDGFFSLTQADGSLAYTRDGSFTIDQTGAMAGPLLLGTPRAGAGGTASYGHHLRQGWQCDG